MTGRNRSPWLPCRYCRSRTRCCSPTCSCRCRPGGRSRWPPRRRLAAEDKTFLALAQRNPQAEGRPPDDLYTVGTRAVIKKMARRPPGIELLVQGIERVALVRLEQAEPYLRARVRPLPLPDDQGPEVEALRRAVLDLTAQAIELAQPEAASTSSSSRPRRRTR